MNVDNLRDMAVVSIQEGRRLGRVEQPLLDLSSGRLGGFLVRSDTGTFVLPFAQIEHVGADAITVASGQQALLPADREADHGVDLRRVQKLKVVDQAGTYLGTVTEVEADPATGAITRLTVHRGGLLGVGGTTRTIDPAAVAGVGPELVTVRIDAASSPPDDTESAADEDRTTEAPNADR